MKNENNEIFNKAHAEYKRCYDNCEVWSMKKGYIIPVLHDDGSYGYVDPNHRMVIWDDGIIECDMSWKNICEYITNYQIQKDSEYYSNVIKDKNNKINNRWE